MTIRAATAADAAAIARVHIASWRSSYPGIIDDAYLAALDLAERTEAWNRRLANPALATVVTERDGELVGFSFAGPDRGNRPDTRGEVYALYLLDGAKGQGLGRALFARSLAWLAEGGLVPVRVWVFVENERARAFYERMGGVLGIEAQAITLGGRSYGEVAYRWDTVPLLR